MTNLQERKDNSRTFFLHAIITAFLLYVIITAVLFFAFFFSVKGVNFLIGTVSAKVKTVVGVTPLSNILFLSQACGGSNSALLQVQNQPGQMPDKILTPSSSCQVTGGCPLPPPNSCRSEYKQSLKKCEKNTSAFLSLTDYIPQSELVIIEDAAKRNSCFDDDFLILLAIRKAENGRAGLEFGVLDPKAINTDLDTQAGWAAATIVKNRTRWEKEVTTARQGGGNRLAAGASCGVDKFITFLGKRYCPPSAHPLNAHWVKNVNFWYWKLKQNLATDYTDYTDKKTKNFATEGAESTEKK